MGNYHPHGDAAIYDAMARLAQDFVIRYPLVDGQGNFGNIDGDNPAASRYTEARMTAMAEALLEGLDEDAVDFRDNYDGTLREPEVLPATVPNLLANGSSGIAVGMATNIPPHNLDELLRACEHLIKTPDARDDTLLNYVKGPDFPTGGVIVEPPDRIAEAYRTGRGAFRLRATWEVEDLGRGTWQIVVTEIPYQVQKSKLIEKLAELIQTKKVPILADVRDESADDIRIVLEPRSKNVDPQVLMGTLFRQSDLETRFSLNMNVLIDGRTPKVCSLKEVLRAFLDHRREVLIRRSKHRMEKIDHRLEVLEGFIIAFLNLDRVIDIIRYDEMPKAALMREDWSRDFTRATSEADYVTPPPGIGERGRLDRGAGRGDPQHAPAQPAAAGGTGASARARRADGGTRRSRRPAGRRNVQWERIASELREVRQKFGKKSEGGARRTQFAEAGEVEEVPLEAMIDREPVTVVCSTMGWIRAMKRPYRSDAGAEISRRRHGPFRVPCRDDGQAPARRAQGRVYTLLGLRTAGWARHGRARAPHGRPAQRGRDRRAVRPPPGARRLVASSAGDGFVVTEDEIVAQTRTGKQVLNVKEGVKACVAAPVSPDDDAVAVVGENRKLLVFALDEVPEWRAARACGCRNTRMAGCRMHAPSACRTVSAWLDPAGRTRTETELAEWTAKRATAGRMAPRGFPRDNRFT
jgi:topoisomerase-4 subunit A